jgi:hypothetical protein
MNELVRPAGRLAFMRDNSETKSTSVRSRIIGIDLVSRYVRREVTHRDRRCSHSGAHGAA